MAATKRKDVPSDAFGKAKKQKTAGPKGTSKMPTTRETAAEDEDFGGFSDEGSEDGTGMNNVETTKDARSKRAASKAVAKQPSSINGGPKQFKLETSSAEAHAKQRELAKERKANKPNSDAIHRSKKIWERLRRKSHVPADERKELVAELFSIVTGRVRDFVFKHDSVRVIQCALKYANLEQRRSIAKELQGDIRTLVESRYGKFLVAKMIQDRDEEIRDAVIPAFYGHVKRLINHPEASWIVDDIYRQVATPQQKATMLREWYGIEFALLHRNSHAKIAATTTYGDTADLPGILEKSPEKRNPILQYLLQMINSLIQRKMTGFTMLHDAMLQYLLTLTPGSPEHAEFFEILKGDIDPETEGGGGDLFRNLAFTRSGSRLVCLALVWGSAKDRKIILKVFKDNVEMMAYDQYAKNVLIVALDVLDDTKLSSKSILFQLLGQNIEDETQRLDRMEQIVTDLTARVPVLHSMAGTVKWLVNDADKEIFNEVHEIRKTTSKKDAGVRRKELLDYMSGPVLELVSKRASSLVQSSFGCQLITEALLETNGNLEAKTAVAQLAEGDLTSSDHIANSAAAGRMLKTLTLGGNFDPVTQLVKVSDPPLRFGEVLYPAVHDKIVEWATSDSSFVVVALLESEKVPETIKGEVRTALRKSRTAIEAAAQKEGKAVEAKVDGNVEKKRKVERVKGNAGAKILLEKIGGEQ